MQKSAAHLGAHSSLALDAPLDYHGARGPSAGRASRWEGRMANGATKVSGEGTKDVATIPLAAIGFQHQHIFGMLDQLLAHPDVKLVALAEADSALRAQAAAR